MCNYKKENPSSSTKDLSINFKMSTTTIRRYLNIGNKLNWCYYDANSEKVLGRIKGKKVEVFKDGISLGIFSSYRELERQSEKLFGTRLIISIISNVCIGERKHYKGFTFKCIKEQEVG